MKKYMCFVWYPVVFGERMSQDMGDALTGRDLWLCLQDNTGYRHVVGGWHAQGFNEGFYYSRGGSIPSEQRVTHLMIRDCTPELPIDELPLIYKVINLVRDFSPFPAGVTANDGPDSAERFRKMLKAALLQYDTVTVELDGTMGYGSSFLRAAFQDLGMSYESLVERLFLKATDKSLLTEIWSYIKEG